MNEAFRSAENIRISTRNSYLKLSHHFRKTSTGQNGLSYLGPLFGKEFQKFWRKPKMWILSNIRWNTTMRVISLIQIYEIVVDWIIFGYHKEHFFLVKVGLSPSKKMCVICFTESPSETIKNAFYLILKALFVLEILKFLLWLFVPVEKTALYSTSYLFFEFWLVDIWFFCWLTSSTCCNLTWKCTPVKYKKR